VSAGDVAAAAGRREQAREAAAAQAPQVEQPAEAPVRAKFTVSRFLIPIAIFGLLAAVFAVGVKHSPDVGVIHSPLIGKPAPAWSLPLLADNHRTIGSQDLRGRWYVLNVWGTWCYACRDEHQALLAIAQHSTVPIIGVDWRDDDAQARNWLAQLGNPYSSVATDHDGHVVIDWGVYGAPESFLVNPSGVVVFKQIGPMTPDVWQKEFASRLPPRRS
jgi:cytochrome c biogenesis protein CcmG, thiol:disulfide interchange protein DsbE